MRSTLTWSSVCVLVLAVWSAGTFAERPSPTPRQQPVPMAASNPTFHTTWSGLHGSASGSALVKGALGDRHFEPATWSVDTQFPLVAVDSNRAVHLVEHDDDVSGMKQSFLTCVDTESGEQAWQLQDRPINALLGVEKSKVYVADGRAKLACIDIKNGKVDWEQQLALPYVEGLVTSAGVLGRTQAGVLQLHDMKKGKPQWKESVRLPVSGSGPSELRADDKHCYLLRGGMGASIHAYALKDGKLKWSIGDSKPKEGQIASIAYAADGRVFRVGSGLELLDQGGKPLATAAGRFEAEEGLPAQTIAVAEGAIYAIDSGLLRELDPSTLACRRIGFGGKALIGRPVVAEDIVVVGSWEKLQVFERKGLSLIQEIDGGGVPILAGNSLIVLEPTKGQWIPGLPQKLSWKLRRHEIVAGASTKPGSASLPSKVAPDDPERPFLGSWNWQANSNGSLQAHGALKKRQFKDSWTVEISTYVPPVETDPNVQSPDIPLRVPKESLKAGAPTAPHCVADGVFAIVGTIDEATKGVVALDVETGKRLWCFEPRGLSATTRLLAVNGVLCVLAKPPRGNGAMIWGVELASGEPVWARHIDESSTLFAVEDSLFVLGVHECIVLDAASGQGSSAGSLPDQTRTVLGFDGTYVSIMSSDAGQSLWQVDLKSGKVAWKSKLAGSVKFDELDDRVMRAVNVDGRLLVYTDSEIVALDALSGEHAWRIRCLDVGEVTESPREGGKAPRTIGPSVFPAATLTGQVLLPTMAGCVAVQTVDGTDVRDLVGLNSISKDVRADAVMGLASSDDMILVSMQTWAVVFTTAGGVVQELSAGGTPVLGCGSLFLVQQNTSADEMTVRRFIPKG